MIDIENELFTAVAAEVRKKFPGAYLTGEQKASPSKFPCVSIIETGNVTYERTADSASNENHVIVTYEINIYSNKTEGKKMECKAIQKVVDERMLGFGFGRIMSEPVPNLIDSTVYRVLSRYRGIVDKNKIIYGR